MTQEEQNRIDSIDYQAPEGENWFEVSERAIELFDEFEVGEAGGSYLVFTHGGLICSLTYDLGLENIITNGSVVGVLADLEGNPEELDFEWEFPLDQL